MEAEIQEIRNELQEIRSQITDLSKRLEAAEAKPDEILQAIEDIWKSDPEVKER